MSLPPISQQTRNTLKRYFSTNQLYDNLKLRESHKPRTFYHQLYTYGTMTLAGLGYILAKNRGYSHKVFGVAFIAAPLFALFQKRELDYYENSSNAIIHQKQLAQEFPIIFQQYNKVLAEVNDEISKQKEILRTLENMHHD